MHRIRFSLKKRKQKENIDQTDASLTHGHKLGDIMYPGVHTLEAVFSKLTRLLSFVFCPVFGDALLSEW